MGNMVLSQEQAFLADILANPDDDTPRLVFADWLTERDGPGDGMRAEFIRVQCQPVGRFTSIYALVERERALLSLVQDSLRQEWRSWDASGILLDWWKVWEFRRGFVERITLAAADWCRYAERLRATQPIREVTLTTRLEPNVKLRFRPPRFAVFLVGESEPFATVSQADWLAADCLAVGLPRLQARVALLWPGIVFRGPDFPETSS